MTAELSRSDWLVLGVLATGATHGFAVSSSLAKDGDLGRIWAVRRPMVYQSVNKLTSLGLIAGLATERSAVGPSRTPLALTRDGRRALKTWLNSPVEHLRDMRPLLLAKLVLLERLGQDREALLNAQRALLAGLLDEPLGTRDLGEVDQVERLVGSWRQQVARAALGFLDEQERSGGHPK